jgi:hypothetical protein
MGQQDVGRLDLVGARGRLGIAGQEGVDEDASVALDQLEAGMAEKSDVHGSGASIVGFGFRQLTGELPADRHADEHAHPRLLGQQGLDALCA